MERTGGCWWWRGTPHGGGYGLFRVGGRSVLAHRVAWVLGNGCDLPAGVVVRHVCDHALCARPSHSIEGTQQDNMDDCHARGRFRPGRAKLTREQIAEIRALADTVPFTEIAARFGLSPGQAWKVARGVAWAALPGASAFVPRTWARALDAQEVRDAA